ncbi:cobyrinic acid a,c-diamide synthase [Thioclava sp. SK-1]|uniref:ParA family partition ATPase n=1 Tax=Thioclava sp. SK-1 TaxID=1889770 RepID=UPI000826B9A7|nr:ParA family partition ATPase [Thioclava sp. SK-1]OCX61067.1 cobyrinic acid a,c-diamide synthase [Thioclava sp. SK-1]
MAKVITVAQQKGGAGKTTLAVTLATGLIARGVRVAVIDTDPQGSLGRWFMTRRERMEDPGLEFSTASAWGVSYECEKLGRLADVVIIDTPPKVDSDLRPALREADEVLIPIADSHVDLWATEGVIDLATRAGKAPKVVFNRVKKGTRLAAEVAQAASGLGVEILAPSLSNRVIYAETLGQGLGAIEARRSPAHDEIEALMAVLFDQ